MNDYDDEPNDIRGYATWIKNRICKNKKDVGEVQMQTPTTDFSMSADESTPMSGNLKSIASFKTHFYSIEKEIFIQKMCSQESVQRVTIQAVRIQQLQTNEPTSR